MVYSWPIKILLLDNILFFIFSFKKMLFGETSIVTNMVRYKCELTIITVILNHIQWLLERNKLKSLQFRSIAEWRSLCLRPGDNHWHISSLHQGGNYVCAVSNGRHLFQDNIKAKWLNIIRKHLYSVVAQKTFHEKFATLQHS